MRNKAIAVMVAAISLIAFSIAIIPTDIDAADTSTDWTEVSDLNELKNAIKNGNNVRLSNSIVVNEDINLGSINIDGNGYFLNVQSGNITGSGIISNPSPNSTNPSSYPITMKGGSISGLTFTDSKVLMSIDPLFGNVTVDNCRFIGTDNTNCGLYIDLRGPEGVTVIKSSSIEGDYGGYSISIQKSIKYGTNAEISKATLEIENIQVPSIQIWGNYYLSEWVSDDLSSEPLEIGKDLSFNDSKIGAIELTNYTTKDPGNISEIVIPSGQVLSAESIIGDGKITAQEGSKVIVDSISVPVEGKGEVVVSSETPTYPSEDDELPFIPPQSSSDDGADTTTYVAVAAAAVVAILAVLAVGISKGKL